MYFIRVNPVQSFDAFSLSLQVLGQQRVDLACSESAQIALDFLVVPLKIATCCRYWNILEPFGTQASVAPYCSFLMFLADGSQYIRVLPCSASFGILSHVRHMPPGNGCARWWQLWAHRWSSYPKTWSRANWRPTAMTTKPFVLGTIWVHMARLKVCNCEHSMQPVRPPRTAVTEHISVNQSGGPLLQEWESWWTIMITGMERTKNLFGELLNCGDVARKVPLWDSGLGSQTKLPVGQTNHSCPECLAVICWKSQGCHFDLRRSWRLAFCFALTSFCMSSALPLFRSFLLSHELLLTPSLERW